MLALKDPPTAIVCGNDLLAAGVVFEAATRGISVPAQLSVVGIDNLDISAHLTPPLTTIHLPTAQLGIAAAERILAKIEGKTFINREELPVALIVRGSTAATPIDPSSRRGG